MNPTAFSSLSTIGPLLADHVWQSTIFAGGAALLVLALKKNQARVRYRIWLAASLKFLVPFSLLVAMGSHLGWSTAVPTAPRVVATAVEAVSHPFSLTVWGNRPNRMESGLPFSVSQSRGVAASAGSGSILITVILMAWFAGCVTVFLARWLNWRTIVRDLRTARRIESGREYDALVRVRRTSGIRRTVTFRSSTAVREPAVVGFFRPVVLWPVGVSDLLDDAQLDAIFVHELSHVRRRDNLAAMTHMVVETVFWFHPIVWWLTTRMVEERERACDETVISYGAQPQIYADGLLKVCKFCLASSLPCVAGVSGSNLTRRIERIMVGAPARALKLGTRIFLSAAAATAVVGPIALGVVNPTPIRAESALTTSIVVTQELPLRPRLLTRPTSTPPPVAASQPHPASSTPLIPSVAAVADQTWTVELTVDGRPVARFEPPDKPYAQGGASIGMHVPESSHARTKDGLAISGFEFLGWKEGQGVLVFEFADVPRGGEPNVYTDDPSHVALVALATYLVTPGQDVPIDETQRGFTPVMRLRVTTQTVPEVSAPSAPDVSPATGQVDMPGNGGVSWPTPIKQVDPEYTEEAKQAKIQGTVLIDAVVQTNGTVGDVRVKKSLDVSHGLDQAAIDAAKKWLFAPCKKNGQPVPCKVELELEFRLRASPPRAPQEVPSAEFGKGTYKADDAGIVLPRPIHQADPAYSSAAMDAKIEGEVMMDAVVLANGTVGDVRIAQSLDKTYGLDDAALAAARKWTFEPGTLDGKAVPVMVTLDMEFRLH